MARPERIDAVLFDFDGTLCNTEVENISASCRACCGRWVPRSPARSSRCSRAGRTA